MTTQTTPDLSVTTTGTATAAPPEPASVTDEDLASVQNTLSALAQGEAAPVQTFVARGETISQARCYRAVLPADFGRRIAEDLAAFLAQLANRELIAYDPSYQTSSGQAFVDHVANVEALQRIEQVLRLGDVTTDAAETTAPVAMCHTTSIDGTVVVGYRMLRMGVLLKRTIFSLEDGRYKPVENPLVYEPGFDALTVDGRVVFTNVSFVSARMDADHRARTHTRATLTTVIGGLRIKGVEEMVETAVSTPAMRGKVEALGRLMERDAEYASHLTMPNLVRFVKEQHIDIEVESVNGQDTLVYDSSPQHRYAILNLLSDDYLRSALTDRAYEAGSKRRLGS